jgi:hypothetical protein
MMVRWGKRVSAGQEFIKDLGVEKLQCHLVVKVAIAMNKGFL